jgi:hypothetical protein
VETNETVWQDPRPPFVLSVPRKHLPSPGNRTPEFTLRASPRTPSPAATRVQHTETMTARAAMVAPTCPNRISTAGSDPSTSDEHGMSLEEQAKSAEQAYAVCRLQRFATRLIQRSKRPHTKKKDALTLIPE